MCFFYEYNNVHHKKFLAGRTLQNVIQKVYYACDFYTLHREE
jgi:hypothetical protein